MRLRAFKMLPWIATASISATLVWSQAKVWTTRELFNRNIGTKEQQTKQFPPHKIIGNMYYVGTETLGSFLVVTPEGNILIDSTYEVNVPVIRKSIEDLARSSI